VVFIFLPKSVHKELGGLCMATKTVGRKQAGKKSPQKAKRPAPAARKSVAARSKPAAPKAVAPVRQRIDPGWVWDDSLPLAQAQQQGNVIYVSGQVAYNSDGQLVGEGDIKAQTRQVFQNIKEVLESAGATMQDIIKINTYITDQSKFMDMLEVRKEIFGDNPPASTAVVVAGLAFPGLLIEVEAIAMKS
jgi:reactive intermediate/imine deaminase